MLGDNYITLSWYNLFPMAARRKPWTLTSVYNRSSQDESSPRISFSLPWKQNILVPLSVCLSVCLSEPQSEVHRLILRRQGKGVTGATGWFWCWAREKGKLYLMGWGRNRKQGFGSVFCLGGWGVHILFPDRAAATWPHDLQGVSQAPPLTQQLITMCTHTVHRQTQRNISLHKQQTEVMDRQRRERERRNVQRTLGTERDRKQSICSPPFTTPSQYTNNGVCRTISGSLADIINRLWQEFRVLHTGNSGIANCHITQNKYALLICCSEEKDSGNT